MSFPAKQFGILASPVPESALANVIKHTATARRTRERLREKTLALRDHMFASGLFTRHARFSPCLISRVSSDTTCAKNLAPLALLLSPFCFFFFQAEDGIRDLTVTGVQTCALPI